MDPAPGPDGGSSARAPAVGYPETGAELCQDGWCWEAVSLQGKDVQALWGNAPDDVWVASARRDESLLSHWNGERWTHALPGLGVVRFLWGSGARDVWAAGSLGVFHWDGRGWTRSLADTTVTVLSGRGAADLWAVAGRRIHHWDGHAWTLIHEASVELTGLWADPAGGVWAVGGSGLLLQGGVAGFSETASGLTMTRFQSKYDDPGEVLPAPLRNIWGTGPGDFWVVGACGAMGRWQGGTLRFGQHGTCSYGVPEATRYQAMGGTGPGDVWFGVTHSSSGGGAYVDREHSLTHFNGKGFGEPVQVPRPVSVVAGGERGLWAGGARGSIWRREGGRWREVAGSPVDRVVALWVDGADRTWAIAMRREKDSYLDTYLLMRRDPHGWHIEHEHKGQLSALGGSGEELWAVGYSGDLLRRVAGKWTRVASPTGAPLNAVWVNAPNDAWALGHAGTALRWDGTTWRQVPTGLDGTFTKAWGSGASDVWAIVAPAPGRWSEGRRVYRWDGKAWGPVEAPVGARAVWGRGPGDVWVAGEDDAQRPWLWHWDGQRGVRMPLPEGAASLSVSSLWGTADRLFVAGHSQQTSERGWSVLRWDGASWTALPLGPEHPRGTPELQGTRDGRLWLGGGDAVLRQQAP